MSLQEDLLSIERELWTGRAESYRENVDESCLVAFPEMAGVWTRDRLAATVEGPERWRELKIEVEGFHRPIPEMALFTYRARATRGDNERYEALVSSAYVRRGGGWKLTFHQQTPALV